MHLKRIRMASAKLSVQDRKDLDRFTKFLALKTVQVIVQSRLGEKLKTKSKPQSSSSDWFNLSIKDLPDVVSESKKAFAGQIPTFGLGMCVEISLKTMEGESMVLETWHLEMIEQCDTSVRVTYTVYNRMSLLLKSLIAVTRVTPAYKLSSFQGAGRFVICYRVYMGEPVWNSLGECYQCVKVGQVGTPVGTLTLSVAYRTQLTITTQKSSTRDCPFIVKSDHFKPDLSPKWPRPPSHFNFHTEPESLEDELAAASEDCLDSHPMVANSLQNPGHIYMNGVDKKPGKLFKECEAVPSCAWDKQVSFSDCKKIGAFATETKRPDGMETDYLMPDVPFSALLQQPVSGDTTVLNNWNAAAYKNCANTNLINNNINNNPLPPVDEIDSQSVESETESHKSNGSITSGTEDFVLVELKTPFAGADGTTDLGTFFRECQSAPPLISFSDQPSLIEQVNDLGNQLATFEVNLHDFDDFVESLCQDEATK